MGVHKSVDPARGINRGMTTQELLVRGTRGLGGTMAGLAVVFLSVMAGAEEGPVRVVVDDERMSCSPEVGSLVMEEMRLRTSAEVGVTSKGDPAGEVAWRVSLTTVDGGCEVRLIEGEGDRSVPFVVKDQVDRLEIATVVNRVVWILDGGPVQGVGQEWDEAPEAEQPAALEFVVDRRRREAPIGEEPDGPGLIEDSPAVAPPRFRAQAEGGALWIPEIGSAIPLVQGGLGWSPWPFLEFGAAVQVPGGSAEIASPQKVLTYRPWSTQLTSRVGFSLGDRWRIHALGGARWTWSTLSAVDLVGGGNDQAEGQVLEAQATEGQATEVGGESRDRAETGSAVSGTDPSGVEPATDPEGRPRRVAGGPGPTAPNALSSWSAVSSLGVEVALTRHFALGWNVSGAFSLADRRVVEGERVILDLGRVEVGALMGLTARF